MDLRRRTVASPKPDDPPVTIATKFLSIFIYNYFYYYIELLSGYYCYRDLILLNLSHQINIK